MKTGNIDTSELPVEDNCKKQSRTDGDEPKADRQPILKVRGGTPVQVVDTAGAWSRIRTEPGWEAWVDGRRLAEPD